MKGGVYKEFMKNRFYIVKSYVPHFVTVKSILIAKECKYKNTYANTNGYCHEIN